MVRTLPLISGRLPGRAPGLVAEWGLLHQAELLTLWDSAQNLQPLRKIDPCRRALRPGDSRGFEQDGTELPDRMLGAREVAVTSRPRGVAGYPSGDDSGRADSIEAGPVDRRTSANRGRRGSRHRFLAGARPGRAPARRLGAVLGELWRRHRSGFRPTSSICSRNSSAPASVTSCSAGTPSGS